MNRRDDFLAEHRTIIGGSDAAACAGLSHWRTPLQVYMEKTGLSAEDEAGEEAYWGRRLEPVILSEYATRNSVCVLGRDNVAGEEVPTLWSPDGRSFSPSEVGILWGHRNDEWVKRWLPFLGMIRHAKHPWIGGHLDGLVFGADWSLEEKFPMPADEPHEIIDAKNAAAWRAKEFGEEDTDDLSDDYLCQGTHYISVVESLTGLLLPVVFPVLLGGHKWKVMRVKPHDAAWEALLDAELEMVRRIEKRDPPEADAGDKKALAALHPFGADETPIHAVAGTVYDQAVETLARARRRFDLAEIAKDAAENQVKQLMGDHAVLTGDRFGGKITWKNNRDSEVTNWEALARELEATAEEIAVHTSTKPGARVFRYKPAIENLMKEVE